MEILTGAQMRSVDRRAIDEVGIPGLDLMEAAGAGVAEALLEDYPEAESCNVVILCGKGNNGGDGLVAARHLAARGVHVHVLLLARGSDLTGDAAANLSSAQDVGIAIHETPGEDAWRDAIHLLEGNPLVLDAILGTGARGGARGIAGRVIGDLNSTRATVLAVDLPSGIDADSTEIIEPVVRATRTYTLCRPKPALIHGPSSLTSGSWRVIDIGIPDACVAAEKAQMEWIDFRWAARQLPERALESHKGTYGHLLLVAGSRGKSGAAVLAARAALRAGVGLLTVATPSACQPLVAVQQPELMTEPLPELPSGVLDSEAAPRVLELLAKRSALALGPGLGSEPATVETIRTVVAESRCPTIIDADGLNALDSGTLAASAPDGRATVLTPHPGEAARLLQCSTEAIQADRLAAARRLSDASGAVVVLKGHRTLVAAPDGRIAVNSSGNPGMASGGTGDVLTGIVGAFLARGVDAWTSARLAVYLHGDAGDRAAKILGQESLLASDLIREMPATIRSIRAEESSW